MNTATDDLKTNSPKSGGGNVYGQSISDKIAFYGKTPVAQLSSSSQAVAVAQATTVFSEAKTGMWAFASSTVAAALITKFNASIVLVNKLRADLVTLGLIKGS